MSLLSRLAVQAARAYGMLVAGSANNVSADYLVVAGGGSGGGGNDGSGGGGGAGGYLTSTVTLSTLNTYSIVVGAGAATTTTSSKGANGSNSSLSGTGITTVTSIGGGAGGYNVANQANTGGSGGGQGGKQSSGNTTGTTGQGNSGGYGYNVSLNWTGGGGGGAGGNGGNGASGLSGAGGAGSASSISGTSITRASGGSGGAWNSGQASGATAGGGGAGGGGVVAGGNATVNTGGGGGGGGQDSLGGAGGSGIVIISYTSATPKFVGGTITTSGGKQIHTFTSSGTLSPITPITASYLVVAGGGGAAQGGGGAGGLLTSSTTLYSGATYVVTVGAGGTGGPPTTTGSQTNGSDSILSGTGLTTLTAVGGGFGGRTGGGNGNTGGSGGGGAYATNGGAGTSGQGFAGGNGGGASSAGGGGGSSTVGSAGSGSTGGNGGAGTASSITGTSVTYAGGGGGAANTTAGSGGSGGGGSGGVSTTNGGAGTPNLGGGGGGGGATSSTGGNGGSGTVIISYAGSQVFNGGLVTTSGGNTIHTFTSTGALTPLTNNLNNSLRFRSSASASLTRTPTVAGNRKTWTFSAWVKRGTITSAATQRLICAGSSDSVSPFETAVSFTIDDKIQIIINGNGATGGNAITSAVFRDPSAWYHIVAYVNMAASGQGNKVRIYVNGNEQTVTYTTLTTTDDTQMNNAVIHAIGKDSFASSRFFDGYMADINFIDGQALEPYYFGNNDANGVWKPIQYKGTYGTNGFYLTFADTSALTTSSNAGLGKDTSGNGNYWTTNNISITSGSTYDPMLDVPTNTSATVANYCVLNPLAKRRTVTQVATFSEANLKATFPNAAGNATFAIGTFGVTSGKWYWEIPVVTRATELVIGIGNTGTLDETNGGAGYQATNGAISGFTTNPPAGASYTSGDIIGVALDVDAGTCAFYKNNSLQGTGTGLLSTPQPWVQGNTNDVINANFGQRPFSYTPPTGFVALNTFNLPAASISNGAKHFAATTYTGNGGTQTVSNGNFQPDFVWIKNRAAAVNHQLHNSNVGWQYGLNSNNTNAEYTDANAITGATSTGWSMNNNYNSHNQSGVSFIGWQWQAGQGTTSSNTSGTITSTVSVNTTAGFSVVTYTGTGSTKTFGHGLGVTPAMFIVKSRSQTGENFVTWHKSFSNTAQGNMALNTTDAVSNSASVWGNTAPTSTLITVGNAAVNNNTSTYVCWAWAEITGFSKFGSYTGNGSTDGPFVFTGFRPKFVLIKYSSGVENWAIWDTSRNTYNVMDTILRPDSTAADTSGSTQNIDFVSNGFKIRGTDGKLNTSSGTYIYAAFAENPAKISNAR